MQSAFLNDKVASSKGGAKSRQGLAASRGQGPQPDAQFEFNKGLGGPDWVRPGRIEEAEADDGG